MNTRRKFIKTTAISSIGLLAACKKQVSHDKTNDRNKEKILPVVISTWKHGIAANEASIKVTHTGDKVFKDPFSRNGLDLGHLRAAFMVISFNKLGEIVGRLRGKTWG